MKSFQSPVFGGQVLIYQNVKVVSRALQVFKFAVKQDAKRTLRQSRAISNLQLPRHFPLVFSNQLGLSCLADLTRRHIGFMGDSRACLVRLPSPAC